LCALQEIDDRHRRAWERYIAEECVEKAVAWEKEEREKAIMELRAQQARNREVNQRRMEEEVARRNAEEQVTKEGCEVQRKN
jgi:hypothetical protein